jgi:GTPase SAR1 family protein
VIIVCYSIDNRDSLENIPNRWIEELQEGCPQAKTILVALKCDLRDDEVALKKIKPVLYEEVIIESSFSFLLAKNDHVYILGFAGGKKYQGYTIS